MRTVVFILAISLAWVGECYAQADNSGWLGYSLKSLTSANKVDLQQYKGKPVLMTFFEPECAWCLKQLKDLSVLQNKCQQQLQVLAMGVNGQAKQLRQLFARTSAEFPALIVSNRMMAEIGEIPATPITVLIDENGQAVSAFRGYQPLAKLKPTLLKVLDDKDEQCF